MRAQARDRETPSADTSPRKRRASPLERQRTLGQRSTLARRAEVLQKKQAAESMLGLDFGSTDSCKRAYACSRTGRLLPNVLSSHPGWRSGKRVPLTRSDPTGGGRPVYSPQLGRTGIHHTHERSAMNSTGFAVKVLRVRDECSRGDEESHRRNRAFAAAGDGVVLRAAPECGPVSTTLRTGAYQAIAAVAGSCSIRP